VGDVWRDALGGEAPAEIASGPFLRLSPLRHGTDGFFAATLVRRATAQVPAPETPADEPDQAGAAPEEGNAVEATQGEAA
jgi:16S rRNA (cytosine967-C5)-methyltransferase